MDDTGRMTKKEYKKWVASRDKRRKKWVNVIAFEGGMYDEGASVTDFVVSRKVWEEMIK